MITNQLLYQLSYTGLVCVRDAANEDTSKYKVLSANSVASLANIRFSRRKNLLTRVVVKA